MVKEKKLRKLFWGTLVGVILCGFVVGISVYSGDIHAEEKILNPYFFRKGQHRVEYEGYFYPLSYRDIWQNTYVNVYEIRMFENAALYALEMDQLKVWEPLDEIRMGGRYIGYFYVTKDAIYYRPLEDMDGFCEDKNQQLIQWIQEDEQEFLEACTIVCCEDGTENVGDENGWHQYVEVDGDKRVFHLYNDYTDGTREYGQMVWEKGKGLVYYRHGTGGMKMHIELWGDIEADSPNRNVMDRICKAELWEISKIRGLKRFAGWDWDMMMENYGSVTIEYSDEILPENVKVALFYPNESEKVEIATNVYLSEDVILNLCMKYYSEEKKLVYLPMEIIDVSQGRGNERFYCDEASINEYLQSYGITKEVVSEYQEYAMYDVVVQSWVDTYGGVLEEEKMELKQCTVDNTFRFEGEKEAAKVEDMI